MEIIIAVWLAAAATPQDTLSCTPAFLEAPTAARISTVPQLKNIKEMQEIVKREFEGVPRDSAAAPAIVAIATDRAGRIARLLITRSSGLPARDSAALRVARRLVFDPATYNGAPVCNWLEVPIIQP